MTISPDRTIQPAVKGGLAEVPQINALRELLALALPQIVQMASYTTMQFLEAWMLARAGDGNVLGPTAVGNAGMLAFTLISFAMGALFVLNTLVSQNYGAGNNKECGRYLWQGIWFALGFSVVMSAGFPFYSSLFHRMGHAPDLVQLEGQYLRIQLLAATLRLLGTAMGQFLLAINCPRRVLLATVCGIGCNIVAGLILVLGMFGGPRLGVVGAGWAQNIGLLVETSCLTIIIFLPGIRKTYNVLDWRLRRQHFVQLLKIGLPSGMQFFSELTSWSLFMLWVMAAFGTDEMAANNFTFKYMSVSFMPAFGISVAVTALVGRYIGMGRPEVAQQRTHLGFGITLIYMLVCGLAFFLLRERAMMLFTQDPKVIRIGATLMVFAALYQIFDATYISYNAALRGAGDTLLPALIMNLLAYGLIVFAAHHSATHYRQWGTTGPWVAAMIYGVLLSGFIVWRFNSGRWKKMHLVNSAT